VIGVREPSALLGGGEWTFDSGRASKPNELVAMHDSYMDEYRIIGPHE
jgi:hypothetical protein